MAKKSKQYDYDLSEVKRLIGETEKNYREIAAETGCPYASVVYHGRKIRGRVNRMRQEEIAQEQPQSFLSIKDDNHTSEEATLLSGGTTLSISRNDVHIQDAEQEAAKMIKAARALGLQKINITINK
ncbi:hypothetical protein SAMN05192559_101463 [Halobacillus karajensis]|uniref:Uncharacterized protein n=1 Tax=Halobacillus karajensis TaxID=195088 RepID=A0A059NYH4_9BACI|nr:hypothetical protein [Halobacillus karajensis]CDQ18900.1 hypothetical protein BN982_01181 [Halobacillus karajensis]CDQ23027.1 hypothetical protein BN983_01246 [Halobacillus karajensis]CDQ26509.1 hypothetical protein BN981_00726 [Halobacillus karajensis]SEH44613.1 hypothetical protein SAMN05192559_101463 [Halobacillus karajensis]